MHESIMMVFHDFGNFEIDFIKNYIVDIINLNKNALSLWLFEDRLKFLNG